MIMTMMYFIHLQDPDNSVPPTKKPKMDRDFKGELKLAFRLLACKMRADNVWDNGQGKELAQALSNLVIAGEKTETLERYVFGKRSEPSK